VKASAGFGTNQAGGTGDKGEAHIFKLLAGNHARHSKIWQRHPLRESHDFAQSKGWIPACRLVAVKTITLLSSDSSQEFVALIL
jgi:hypothetical protein